MSLNTLIDVRDSVCPPNLRAFASMDWMTTCAAVKDIRYWKEITWRAMLKPGTSDLFL